MNILIVKLSAIGDVIHTLPSLAVLRTHYPDAHITWVIEEAAADLIVNHPHLDRVIVSRRKGWIRDIQSGRFGKAYVEIRSFIKALRSQPYDLVIDFHGLLKSAVIVFLSRGKRKLGYDSLQELSGLFLTEKIPEDMNKHAVNRYLDFVRYLGADTDHPSFFIPVDDVVRGRIANLLRTNGLNPGSPFIAVSPQAFWETKLWDDDKFARLCDRIVAELNIPIVFTGSEQPIIASIQSRMQSPAVYLAGQTTLRELACLFNLTEMLITTDSGPMHLAAAMKTPVVSLFGPTDPKRTGPYGQGHRVIHQNLPCSPCFLKTCDTRQCMTEISVDHVFKAVQEKLEVKRAG